MLIFGMDLRMSHNTWLKVDLKKYFSNIPKLKMSKIIKILFTFLFVGWSSMIILSIIYGAFLGGVAYLILGLPSGITVGLIAFIYGIIKGPKIEKDLERKQEAFKRQMELITNQENSLSPEKNIPYDDLIKNYKTINEGKKNEFETQTLTIDTNEDTNIYDPGIQINESNYLLDAYHKVDEREGGMAKVFICRSDFFKDEEYVAVKVLKGFSDLNLDKIKNWLYECHSHILLGQHPNIVQIKLIHRGVHSPQIVMEYVENSLDDLIPQISGDIIKIIGIGINICDALSHANNQISNFVHKDLKPQNILISSDFQAKLTDFGIIYSDEKTSQLGELKFSTPNFPKNKIKESNEIDFKKFEGTFAYASPEQFIENEKVDTRSDIYSFGCILYELITGEKPFSAGGYEGYRNSHQYSAPLSINNWNNNIPPELLDLTYKCLAKRKEDRFNSFFDLRKELARIKKRYFNLESPMVIASPPNEDTIISLIETLIKIGDYEKVRQYSESINKKLFYKFYFPALCDSYEKNFFAAIPKFKYCLKYASTEFEKVLLHKEWGFAVESSGDLNEALNYFNVCTELYPNQGVFYADIARIKIKLGKTEEAIQHYKHSLDLAYDPGIVVRYVHFLIDIKRFEDAIRELKKGLLLFTDNMEFHIYLADASIGKIVEEISNNNIIPREIDEHLKVAKKYATIALNLGFQTDKAKEILSLHDMINKKIIRSAGGELSVGDTNTATVIQLDNENLNNLDKAIKKFNHLKLEKRFKELIEMFYPVVFLELSKLTGIPIPDIKKEFIQVLASERENSEIFEGIIKDIRLALKHSEFFENNGKIYTSFQNENTIFRNGKFDHKSYVPIAAISENGGTSWYFMDLNEENKLAYDILSKELPERMVNALYPRYD